MEIRRDEAIRYLGANNQRMDKGLEELLDSCIDEIKQIATPLYVYRTFKIEEGTDEVRLVNQGLSLKGSSIVKHLKDSIECVIIAATLGIEVDRIIKKHQVTSLTRGVLLDACASAAIEGLCDEVEVEIRNQSFIKGLSLTSRFSPGYGDFPLENQSSIIQSLAADRRIGLMTTEENLLLPRKSVTAIIGLSRIQSVEKMVGCGGCNSKEYCRYRREEKSCELFTKL